MIKGIEKKVEIFSTLLLILIELLLDSFRKNKKKDCTSLCDFQITETTEMTVN